MSFPSPSTPPPHYVFPLHYPQALAGALFVPSSRVTVERFTPLTPLGVLPGVLEFTMNVTFTLTVICDPTIKAYCLTSKDVTNAVYSLSAGVSFTHPRALQTLLVTYGFPIVDYLYGCSMAFLGEHTQTAGSAAPSYTPTMGPKPTSQPTHQPTQQPTEQPTRQPSRLTTIPSSYPRIQP